MGGGTPPPPINQNTMQGYFSQMYHFYLSVIKYKDVIDSVWISNTANACKSFHNITIEVKLITSERLSLFFMGKTDEKNLTEATTQGKILRDAYVEFYKGSWKWDCDSWRDLVSTMNSIYVDMVEVFNNNELNIPIYYNAMGFHNHKDAYDDLTFDKAKRRAEELDAIEFVKKKINASGTYVSISDLLKKIDEVKETVGFLLRRQWDIDKVIKEKKRAYILSKLIENKAARRDYESYPELIEAYDAYVDVKNIMSGKTHRL